MVKLNIPITTKALAVERIRAALQQEIERAESEQDRDLALEIASVLYQIKQRFEREQKGTG